MANKDTLNALKTVNEKTLDKALRNWCVKGMKGLCFKLETNLTSGLPDRVCLLFKGIVFFVEVKTPGQKPTKIQLHLHKLIRRLGFDVWVLDSVEVLEQIKDYYSNNA